MRFSLSIKLPLTIHSYYSTSRYSQGIIMLCSFSLIPGTYYVMRVCTTVCSFNLDINKRNGFNPEWIKALDLGCVVIWLQRCVVPVPTEARFPLCSVCYCVLFKCRWPNHALNMLEIYLFIYLEHIYTGWPIQYRLFFHGVLLQYNIYNIFTVTKW